MRVFFSDSQIFLGDHEKTWLNRHCKLMCIYHTLFGAIKSSTMSRCTESAVIFCYTAVRCNSSIDSLSNHWALRLKSQISKPSKNGGENQPKLVGGFNPSEKYESNWTSSPFLGVKIKK